MLRCLAPQVFRPTGATQGCAQAVRCFAVGSNHMVLIKELRESSGAPISDVKAALQQASWDLDLAAQELRKKGVASAGKKASRLAAEGLVGVASGPLGAAIVEVNSETDFVPRNDSFKQLVSGAAAAALSLTTSSVSGPEYSLKVADLLVARIPGGERVEDAVAGIAGTVRENVQLRRAFLLPAPAGGVIGSYVHQGVGEGLGKIAALVSLAPANPGQALAGGAAEAAADLARRLGMQVVASVPQFLNKESVTEAAMEEEKAILRDQALSSGKPAAIVEKMVAGRMQKYYQEVCLLEQPFVMDDSKRVRDVVAALGGEVGIPLKLEAFLRVKVGEGVEKEDKDFAAEVAATLQEASKA